MVYRVKLKPDWPSSFHRTVLIGGEKTELFFMPGAEVELDAEQYSGIQHDIGAALVLVDEIETVKAEPVPLEMNNPLPAVKSRKKR